jgi:hypothetical protein
MVVPSGGSNVVMLETNGVDCDVKPANGAIRLEKFDGRDTIRRIRDWNNELMQPGVDAQVREAFLPAQGALHPYRPWYYRVHGRISTGFPGTLVRAVPRPVPGRRTPLAEVTLRVVVVDRMVIKVAIRNVHARDKQGAMRLHAKQPCDLAKEVAQMNAIWTPQTNIVFEPVASTDLVVDHNDSKTQQELHTVLGLEPGSRATFHAGSTVHAEKFSGWFANHKVPDTHITFFLVHQAWSSSDVVYGRGGYPAEGTMNRQLGVSFISGNRLPSTFAHEAGHWLGDMRHEGEDISLLMRAGGSGYRIPFKLVQRFREYAKHPRSQP